ncbi:MAG: hypothetical protein BMS9Abin36_1763 [Gammaproteobacteria bacterium]|nr:MAG: hypothetical protein BMS9Abin36_1763 [Gammaproteobacteria bacterium]
MLYWLLVEVVLRFGTDFIDMKYRSHKTITCLLAGLLSGSPVIVQAQTGFSVVALAGNPSFSVLSTATGYSASNYSSQGFSSLGAGSDFLADDRMGFESLNLPVEPDVKVEHEYRVLQYHSEYNQIKLPHYRQQAQDGNQPYTRLDAWGLSWQHKIDADSSFELAAHRGVSEYANKLLRNTTSTMASMSWTSYFTQRGKTSLTGSIFVGDEAEREQQEGSLERQFYGFSIGGRLNVFEAHTPYLSLKMQKSSYVSEDPLYVQGLEPDYFSRLVAGWSWQVKPNWSVQAEANYTYTDSEWASRLNSSKLFFGTRYDFR